MPYVKTWIADGRRHSQYVGCAELNSDATAAVIEGNAESILTNSQAGAEY
jgi:hypothetical protein